MDLCTLKPKADVDLAEIEDVDAVYKKRCLKGARFIAACGGGGDGRIIIIRRSS